MTHYNQTRFAALGFALAGAAGGVIFGIVLGLLHSVGTWPVWVQSASAPQLKLAAAVVLLVGAVLSFGEDAAAKYHDDAKTHEVDA